MLKRQQLLATSILCAALIGCAANIDNTTTGSVKAGPSVRIEVADDLGSGVAIGNGLVLTAAHVVTTQADVKVVLDTGASMNGHVLWVNTEYDLALVRIAKERVQAAHLDCRAPKVGEPVTADGNPMGLRFVRIDGTVASAPYEYAPKWKSAYVINMHTIGGMSGGALFDKRGEVIGTVVGTLAKPNEQEGEFGFVVPSTVACSMLGRV